MLISAEWLLLALMKYLTFPAVLLYMYRLFQPFRLKGGYDAASTEHYTWKEIWKGVV